MATAKRKTPAATTRIRNARAHISSATLHADRVASDPTRNRSTRTRQSYKIKAQALDRVAAILLGR